MSTEYGPEDPGPTSIDTKSNAVVDAVKGFVKGNTADLLGMPADVSHLIKSGLSKNSTPAPAEYGAAYFRKIFFGANEVEDKSGFETVGSMISPGGLGAASKAMIVGAIPRLAMTGVSAKSANKILTEVDKLQHSEEAVQFFQGTGVFKTPADSAAKMAISDASARLNPKLMSKTIDEKGNINTVFNKETTLGEVLDHPELYKLYPQLKDTKVVTDMNIALGEAKHSEKTNTISLGPQPSVDMAFSRILHETQHAVQAVENFAYGTSQKAFASKGYYDDKLVKSLQDKRAAGDKQAAGMLEVINQKRTEAYGNYLRTPGESEARFTESTRNMSQKALDVRIEEVLRNPLPVSFWDK